MSLNRRESAGYLTNWAARLFARAIDRRLKSLGLSSGQLPVFFALADGEAMTQKQLAQVASTEQPTMAATLARMARDGLIERRPDPKDRRSTLITLSPAAREKLPAVMEATMTVNGQALAKLSAEEREAFLTGLKSVIATLSGKPEDQAL
ncbi:MarR family transcriptional regulator [Chelativorans sp. AA-79]|uniref:MarR family winged helix-turn-helix transcriptional regulator n=1 Tax=Chelativorans sp. AA-79 TaxID=3028735 RepID=UPI0023F788C7|nr:MarR family transcriptional regulator [Chelativorans sp. AA-79]WEX07910.1 MarR family transcriptional regulator [Chelativorans sp. AA-79]